MPDEHEKICYCTPEERAFLDSLWDRPACAGLPMIETFSMAEIAQRYAVLEDDGELD